MIPTVVAVPGTLCAPAVFDALRDRLQGRARVEAVSWMSGDGPWSVPDIAGRMAEDLAGRDAGPVLLAGHSTGGAIAMRLACDHPELVAGLLLIGTGPHMRGHGDVDALIERMERDWGPEVRESVLLRSFATPVTAEFRAALIAYADSVPQQAVLQVLRSQRDLDLTPELAGLRRPAVVLHGSLDPTRPVERARELAAALPAAELRVVRAGHSPMHEAPDATAAAVVALAARSVPAPADRSSDHDC